LGPDPILFAVTFRVFHVPERISGRPRMAALATKQRSRKSSQLTSDIPAPTTRLQGNIRERPMGDVFVCDAIRTPIGRFGGSLAKVRADDLAATPIKPLMAKHPNLDWSQVDEVYFGCANQAGEDNRNVARMALLLAGIPISVPGETINRLCSSGMSAVINAARAIKAGDGDVFIAGGVEHMTRGPWVISKTSQPFGQDAQMYDSSFGWRFINPKMHELYGTDPMGITAENLAEMYNISREDQDLFAYRSHMKAAAAQQSGRLAEEIAPVSIAQKKGDALIVKTDEFIKAATTTEKLAQLKP